MKNNSKLKRVITILMSIIVIVGATIVTNNIVKNNFKEGINKLNNHNYRASAEALRSAINGTQDVTFDAYFLDNSNITSKALLGPITGPIVSNVPNKEMYMELRVTGDGHLKDGKIAINGTNASVIATLVPDNVINGVYVGKASEIKLKNVASGTTRIIKVKVYPKVLNKDYFIRDDNKITFTGTYVANDGTETPLEKNVNFSVETMYDKVKAESTLINSGYINEYNYTDNQKPYAYFYLLNRGEQINNVQSNVSGLTSINNTIKEFEYRVQVPKFNGYNAESVNVTVNNYQNNNAETNYDKNTGELVIKYKYIGNNNTNIRVEYPVEAGKDKKNEELKLEGNLKLTAYNNPNYNVLESTSTSVVKAKINYYTRTETKYVPEYINFRGVPTADIPIDRYDGSTTTPKSETYNVEWNPYLDKELAGEVELTESKNDYGDKLLNPELNIGNVVTNKGISFYINPTVLNENSTIKIYNDETNELIHTFDRNEIIEYQNKIYNYNTPIKHVKVVLNNINLNKRYAVKIRHEKEINDEELIKLTTKESFLNLRYIKSSFQQKTSDQTVTANTSANYIRTNTPSVGIYLERHNKIKEQAAYNGQLPEEDNEFIYSMDINSTNGTKGIRVIDENGVAFGKTKNLFGDTIKADDYIHYKGIYFERNGNLPDNFNLKIYDNDTNQLVATFTKSDITKYYNKEKAFIYSNSIKHIRIDTNSTVNMKHIMNINTEELVKGINEKTYYNEAKYIVIKPKFARIVSEGQEYTNYIQLATNNDTFIQKSYITGSLNKPLNTYQKQKNVNQEISLKSEARNQENYYESTEAGWKNSTVLIEYPEEIKKLEINKITPIDNSLAVVGYDKFEKDGKQYLKVYLQSDKPVNQPSFNIDSNITVDPLAKSKNTTAKIYYYNSYQSSYLQYINETKDIFDINNNGSTEDNVGYSTMNVTIVSPDTLVISQEITGYNTKGETTYAPGTGIIESNGTGTATVKVQLANYWTPSVSNIKLIGKIPFSNNISPLSKQALNSDFTTTMTSAGIRLPNDLDGIAKVYYSELVDPSMEDRSLWKTRDQITDWNNIKSFYIDLGSKVLGANATETITYNINVPLNIPMNEKSYATVAGTFDLNTERDGNLSSSAESNKVGIQLVKRYNLNITSLVKGRETAISNSLYSVENNEEDEESKISKTILTDTNGHAVAQNLKVNEEYTLTEKSIDENYESRNARIKFKLAEENGRLSLKITEGNEFVKESSEIQPTGTTNAEANIKIEYLKKYKITINKKSLFDKSNLKNVGYKLSSSNESNKYGNTDINGNLTFSGLKTNVIYTLTETVAPMHYINPEITFKVTESNGTPSISIIKGSAESINILETREKQNQANISILDEKVKTYTLKVVKYEKGNLNKRLAHAQFLITGDGILNGKVVETDDNGEATITGLYEYKPGQQYKGEYIIEELVPPEGYQGQYKVGLKVQRDAGNIARVMATTTELDIKNAEQDNPTVMLFAANEPLFKIIKKDAKTSELLPNTKFGISKVDDSGNESEALDINNNPVGTLENIGGKQYRTITTNEKGEYSAGLKSGKYKFVELQPSNEKYELPQNEADRTYTVNVGEPAKAKYKFVEDKNLEKIPEVTKSYGETVGLRRTFVNGEVIHYTLKKDKTDKIGNNRILTIYDNEFNVKKEVTFDSGTPYQMPEINIGKDGSIYSYIPKLGIRKYSPDGRFISQVGDYFGFSRYQYNRLKWDMGAFGNSLFDNDTKSVPFQNPVVKNNDASVLLEEAYNAKRKPSMKNGVLSIDYSNQSQTVLTVYDNELNILSKIKVDTDREAYAMYRENTFDQVYDDYEGNIYVNNIKTNNIDVYDRSGTLKRSIERKGEDFTVLPDGKIYFFKYLQEGKGETSVEVTVTDEEGNEIANTTLAKVRFYERFKHINVTADGSIEYSDNYNTDVINKKVDLKLETPAKPPQSEIVVENKLKKFKITTTANSGGEISGKDENPYEEVEIYSNSQKDIVISPYAGYLVEKITINGEEYPLPNQELNPAKRQKITLPKFTNITEDKNINVVFRSLKSKRQQTIITHYYLKDTAIELAPSTIKYYEDNDDEQYTTEPIILDKYELEKNEQGEYVIPENASGTIGKIKETGNNEIKYYYVKKKAKVITKYIVEKTDGSTEEIKSKEEQTLDIDSQYTTSSDLGNPKYELVRIEGNPRGTIESTDDINVKYVYKLKDTKVNVKYLDVTESETGTPLSSRDGTIIADKVINGQVDDAYRTQEAENVQPNYSLVETPNNASGNMTVDPITVIYKYRKVTPRINDINVSKVGPEKIVSKTQLNLYNITFRVNISDYIGTGKVRLKDKLPYPIHYEESDKLAAGIELDGGIYNSETNEIIWDIPISDINTYEKSETTTENNVLKSQNGTSTTIEINKNIIIRYKDLPNYNQVEEPNMENTVLGKIMLDRNNEREVQANHRPIVAYNKAITIKKNWNDNNNIAGKRPQSVTFALYKTIDGKESKVGDYTLTGNKTTNDGWETKIEQLPIYDGVTPSREIGLERACELGNRITYRVEETTTNKFYQSAATTPSENEFLLTNTFTVPDEKIEVQVNKVWDDNSNANGKRPASIKYVLNGGKTPVEEVVTGNTTTNDGWGYKFTNLAKYDDLGNEITYTVSEQEVNTDDLKFYTNRVSGEYKTGLTITNTFTVPDEKISVQVNKQWDDDANIEGIRPTKIKYVLKGGNQPIEKEISGDNDTDEGWSYRFENLPKYNEHGNEIDYKFEEKINSDLYFPNIYDAGIYENIKTINIRNEFTKSLIHVNVSVSKLWKDNKNINGKRPASIKIILKGNDGSKYEEVLNGDPNEDYWIASWLGLPQYTKSGMKIYYTATEEEVNKGDLKFYTNNGEAAIVEAAIGEIPSRRNYYTNEIEGSIINTFTVPDEKVSIAVTKHWEDSNNVNHKRPQSIKYILTGGGISKEQIVTGSTTTDDNWNYTFTDLPKYNSQGNEITYTVDEQEVNASDLKFYTKSINKYNITNTFTVPDDKININVTKHWNDNGNITSLRPQSIKYILTGGTNQIEQTVSGNTNTDENWNYKFENLPKYNAQGNEIDYQLSEDMNNIWHYSNQINLLGTTGNTREYEITNNCNFGMFITNIGITKKWNDHNNVNGKRPTSIKFVLHGSDGSNYEETATGDSHAESWNISFSNIHRYTTDGNPITYTLQELEVNSGDLRFYTNLGNINVKFTQNNDPVTAELLEYENTFAVPLDTINVTATKHWEDNSNANGKRPASIKYILKGGSTPIEKVVTGSTTTDDNWNYTFTDLPKYNSQGNEIAYTIDEQEVNQNDLKFYKKSINKYSITNTFTVPDEKTEVQVNKTWEDNSNVNRKRPASIKYVLTGNGLTKEQTVTGSTTTNENWSYKFTDLPKYNAQGNEITYTIDEQEVNQNDLKFYTKQVTGLNVTNTFTVPDEKIEVQVNKVWEDNSNANGKRPASIKYVLLGNGLTKEQTVSGNTSTNDNWSYKFTDLPKYDAQGNEIVYTVAEQEATTDGLKFYSNEISGEYKTGITIKNTFKVPEDKIELEVTKHWEDNSNINGKRPISIKYVVSGNNKTKEEIVTGNTTTDENWNYKFTDLAKYDSQGNEIAYTIDEQEVTPGDLKFYNKSITGLNNVNTFHVPDERISVNVSKHWEDNNNINGKRPASIKYVLTGEGNTTEQVVTGNTTSDTDWNYTFTNLPKYNSQGNEIIYTIEEQETNQNDLKFYVKQANGNYKNGFNMVNTFKVPLETVDIAINKHWVDDNNANGKRPTSIKYVLSGNNQTKEQTVTGNTTTDADWNYTFTNLPKYNAQGNEISYTVDEQEVNSGDFKFYTKQVSGLNVTNTFTVPNDKVEVQVNKAWEDNSNANSKRPASIKYVLTGNGLTKEQVVTGNTSTNENWSYKFTDLPKYNAQGNEIVYTVAEREATADGLKFYSNEITGEYKTGITIKNKFKVPEDKIEVEVTKHWEDNSNANHRRPTSIKYVLKGNGLTKEQEVIGNISTDENWNYTFTNLPKYNAQGNEIVYTVDEQEVNANDLKFYAKEVNGFNVTNTFKVPEEKINVKATKTWIDSSNAKGKRPSSIKYILKGGATPIEKVVSGNNTTDENWSYTFENLAKYDSNGQEYQYSVEEEITENAHLYTKVITGSKESGFNVINTFKVPEDKITIAVTKEWKDNSNVASKRPASIKYVLKGGATPIEEVVSGNNTTDADWNHTFTNVAKYNDSGDEITYTLEEQEASANDFKFYKKAISGDYKSGFNVVNTFEVPDEKVEVQVNKVWEDDSNANTKRPASIKYILKGGVTPIEQVVSGKTNSNADWSYKFTNLPKYSATGDEITYTLEEQEVNTDELKFYEKEITGSMNSGFNIKNKFKVPEDKIAVNVVKTWEDNSNVNGKRPASIKYVLSGNGSTKEQTVTGNTTTNDNWSYTFANLPKYNAQGDEITYTVEEQEVNPGDLKFYEKQVNGDYQSGFNVTNTFRIPDDKVKVKITKKWEDSSNVSNKRPSSVNIELSDGANVVRTQELTGTGNEWKHTFTDLPKYNSQGNTITYTLEEKEVNPGDLQFYTKSIVGNTITNTFTQSTDKINVNVSKTWNDSNNANRKRPVSIKYVLKNKETVVSEKVVAGNETTDADWTHTFTGLAKYDEHNDEIKYTLEEQEANEGELKFYTKQVNGDYKAGFNVVNTFKVPDERINVNVSKTWNDNSNANNKRPASIKYVLSGNGSTVEQIVTGESNTDTNWSYEFSNLVKYEANTGNEISYTVREEEVNPGDLKFYEPTISGDYKVGINVTNKFVVPNDKVTPRVTITWEDNNNNGNKRPSNVKIIVKDKEGKVVKEGNVTGNPTDEEWNKVFENVPKYDKNGDPIPYTVEEKPNSPDDFKFYKITVTGDIDKGYKVTNKFEVPDEKVTVKVKKVWEDSNNAASKRPTAIKVQLKNNAAIVREERVTGSGNEWTYTFENVSKYNGYGDVINYTVEEIEEQTEDLKFYEKKITGDKDSEYVITNKFKVPDEKIEINVNKTWEDNNNAANKRPQSIKYILKGGAAEVEQVVSGNRTTDANWNYTFTDLAKYNAQGNEITYKLEEQEVNVNDLKFYTKKISGEQTNGFAVVNKFTVPNEKITVKVSKTWEDESNKANKRPSSIKYEVLNRNNQIVASKVQIGNKNTADGWSHNFELDKYDALGNEEMYNVQEVEVNQNDFKFYKATVSGNYKNGFTVTNKFEVPNEEVTPKITVEWKDNSNQNNKRPTSVKIQVKDEEGRIVKESPVTGLITEESWKKIFENVPKYNKNADPINYTITEEPNNPNDLEFYTITTSGNITEGFKVVNTYAVPGTTISLKANKKWVDGNNAKNKRPESIKIEVRNNNEVVADKEVKGNRTTDANWEVEFKNLPKYNPTTGAENVYTVTETEVHQGELRYYTSVVNGNTITNTIKPITEGKIEDSKVEKESTLAKITKVDEIVPYTITYKGKIKEYMGDAVVKIVDELPFKLDLSKSNITDGSYDDESKTITWIENLNNIDTFNNGNKEIEIKKEIKLVYKDLKISEDNLKVTNKVRAEINLKETNKKITENNIKEIPAEIGSKVTVKYVLKSNRSMKLKEDKVITGHVGDAYQTTIPNDIDQDAYEFVEVEGNENGKISQEEKVVTYLYKKKFGRVVVSYVEKSTGMKLQNDEVIKGNINEPYNAEAKDIEYYNLVSTEKSENVKPVITEEDQKITHYYEKKVFNIEIDKELKEATIDGEKRTFRNGKFTKLDIPVKKILNSEVKVRYSINVRNTGEIKGSTVVQENIPKYFTMNPSENPDWRIEKGKIVSKEIELNPGESKELSITLKWTNSKDNFGTLVNKVGIEKTKNNAGFEETDTEEEKKGKKQQATLVLVPKTGLDINKVLQMTGVGITLTALLAAMGYTISRKVRDEYIN